jgi:glucose/arabinose dehydrogenase
MRCNLLRRWKAVFASSASRPARRRAGLRLCLQELEARLALTTLPAGFHETLVTTNSNLSAPTAMEFSPLGQLWVLEQAGVVKLVRGDGSTHSALTLSVDSAGERGLLGIAFDPNYAANRFVYLYYTNPNPGGAPWATGVHNQLSRFTVNDSNPLQPVLINEAPILDWNNLSGATNHNGGAIHFGLDGMLYANAGDNVQSFTGTDNKTYRVSQTLNNLLGKQLRIDVSKFNSGIATRDDVTVGHLIPSDNPFVGTATATGINKLIYALGLRNPFTFAVQPGTGRILINDVGETTWEEINDSLAGANYGWSGGSTDGFGHPPPSFAEGTYHDPLLAYAHSGTGSLATGAAIVGGTFYNPATVQFPASYVGMYFYQDLASGWIRYFNPNNPNNSLTPDGNSVAFASNTPGGLRDLKVDSAGNLYYLSGGNGEIYRISTNKVEARNLFYNQSKYDGNSAAINATDDAAIATDKVALLPGAGAARFANVSSYSRGVNGVMVDIGSVHGSITAADFIFRVGNNNSPSTWTNASAPASVSVRVGGGVSGSDRVEIVWADNVIQKKWLQVITRASTNTGLPQNPNLPAGQADAFFFGHALGDTGAGDTTINAVVNAIDEGGARNNPQVVGNNIPLTNLYDFNRDGIVNAVDEGISRNNATNSSNVTRFLNIGSPPLAPQAEPLSADDMDAGVASAISVSLSSGSSSTARAPNPGALQWLDTRTSDVTSTGGPLVRMAQHLEEETTPRARAILAAAEEFANCLGLADELLDSRLVD